MKIFQIILIFLPVVLHSYTSETDTLAIKLVKSESTLAEDKSVAQFFQFPDIDKKFPIAKGHIVSKTSEFSFENIAREFPGSPESVDKAKSEAEAGFKEIDSAGRWISSFSNEDIQVLPVGIKHKINEIEYQIGFMKASFTKDHTELLVFVKLILPQTDKEGLPVELFFGTDNVKLSHQGGIIDGGDLVLLGDIFIPFNAGKSLLLLKGGFDYQSSDVDGKTFVTIDCDGFKEMQIEGEVQFSRNVVLPLDEQGNLDPRPTVEYEGATRESIQIPNRVKGEFKATGSSWNDLVAEVSLTPFVIAGQEERFTYQAKKAVFDFSDVRNEGVSFPSIYGEKGWLEPNPDSWQGVYIELLEIGLPKAFKGRTKDGQKRVSFEAADMILDSHGVSGSFSVLNLISIDEGRTSESNAWAYSVDKMTIELVANHLAGAGFEGQLILPISDKIEQSIQEQQVTSEDEKKEGKLGLAYKGLITEEEFLMRVAMDDTLDFEVFKAKAQLLSDSAVELKVVDGSFRPKAILNGRMAISANQKESLANEGGTYESIDEKGNKKENTVEFQGIQFQGLEIQTVSPLISVDYFGYNDRVALAGFPASISDIEFNANDSNVQLDFNLKVNLMNANDKGFSADARIGIKGKNKETEGKQKWKYDGIDLSEITLEKVNIGPMELSGNLFIREQDSIYGKGFGGDITLTLKNLGGIKSKAIFGKKDFRYWYVDAAVRGLKIGTGAMEIEGFAGGAFYRMTRKPGNVEVFSPSGLSYVPSKKTSLGVKAMVFGAIASKNVVSFGAGYEIEFSNSFGVNRMGIYGEAQIMKEYNIGNPEAWLREKLVKMADNDIVNGVMDSKTGKTFLDKAKEEYEPEIVKGEGVITAYLGMNFDLANKSFHATLDAYVDTPGHFIRGVGDNGKAGWGEIYIGKDDWFVYIGIPDNRIGLKMGVGPASVKLDGYFMTGTKIPGSPPPPSEVAAIVGVDATELDYMRDENALGTGRGFAFGTDFSFDTGNVRFLMLYARLKAGLGFDLMMKNYGDARCANTGDQVGINGWYTNGQAYAYVEGEIGIRIKLFFKKKKIRIFKGGAAILMQAKLPNPFWMRGYMSGDFDVLNGLVSGRFRFKVTIGKQCEFENEGPLNGIKMIADVSPVDNESGVNVFTAPQATFSLKVNQPIIIPEDNGDNTYKVLLEKFTVTDESGEEIPGNLIWESSSDRVSFVSEDILPPATKLKATVSVSFQEKINGVFQTIMEDGKKALETEERNFTTGTAPDHIPLQNIQYAYPVVEQHHFYKDEYKTGYIKLKQGQDYLFDDEQWQSVVKYIGNNGEIKEAELAYNTAENKVQYTIPDTDKEADYQIAITSSTKGTGTETSPENTVNEEQDLGDNNVVRIKKNTAESILKEGEIERLAYAFSTSKFRTFAAKIKSISVSEDQWGKISSDVIFLTSKTKAYEGFDLAELKGNPYTESKRLVQVESDLKDAYFTKAIDPVLYQKYPQGSIYSISRNPMVLGFRPKRALPVLSNYITGLEHRVNQQFRTTTFPYRYNLTKIYHDDYMDIRDRVINDYVNEIISGDAPELSIKEEDFKFMWEGRYNIRLQYVLPGGIQASGANYIFKNPIKL